MGGGVLCGGLVISQVKLMSSLCFWFVYSDKLAHVQVVNCWYSIVQLCTCEDTLAHNLGAPYFDDVMSHNSLTTIV